MFQTRVRGGGRGGGRGGLVVKGGLVGGELQASLDINMYTIKIIYYVQHLQTDQ